MRAYLAEHYGDIASVFGLAIAIVGFWITIRSVHKAEKAAEEARREATEAVERLRLQAFLNDVEGSVQLAREIVASCRTKQWIMAMDRCEQTRARLAKLRENPRLLAAGQELAAAVNKLTTLMRFMDIRREKSPDKGLPRQKSADLDAIVVLLSGLCAQIAAKIEEN